MKLHATLLVVLAILVHGSLQQNCCQGGGSSADADILFQLYKILFFVTSTTTAVPWTTAAYPYWTTAAPAAGG
ncbi:hypothetical protein HA402_015067 [Bradysia odoriphaga]|nr:hypothetical protein HA402_015067 [Bradysia odoriphaga]